MKRFVNQVLFLRKARTRRQRQGFLLIELVMALGLFLLLVGVATRLVADMTRISSTHITRSRLLRLAQTGAESSAAQRQGFVNQQQQGAATITFGVQRAGQGVQRTRVRVAQGQHQAVQLVVVD